MLTESKLVVGQATWTRTVTAGNYWIGAIRSGDVLRITDLMGNQAVDSLFFNANKPHERYSAFDTIREQGTSCSTWSRRAVPMRCIRATAS